MAVAVGDIVPEELPENLRQARNKFITTVESLLANWDSLGVRLYFVNFTLDATNHKTKGSMKYTRAHPQPWTISIATEALQQMKVPIKDALELKLQGLKKHSGAIQTYVSSYVNHILISHLAANSSAEINGPMAELRTTFNDLSTPLRRLPIPVPDGLSPDDQLFSAIPKNQEIKRRCLAVLEFSLDGIGSVQILQRVQQGVQVKSGGDIGFRKIKLFWDDNTYRSSRESISLPIEPDGIHVTGDFYFFDPAAIEDALSLDELFKDKFDDYFGKLERVLPLDKVAVQDVLEKARTSTVACKLLATITMDDVIVSINIENVKKWIKQLEKLKWPLAFRVDSNKVVFDSFDGFLNLMHVCTLRVVVPVADMSTVLLARSTRKLPRYHPPPIAKERTALHKERPDSIP